jgi:hypothetical protein
MDASCRCWWQMRCSAVLAGGGHAVMTMAGWCGLVLAGVWRMGVVVRIRTRDLFSTDFCGGRFGRVHELTSLQCMQICRLKTIITCTPVTTYYGWHEDHTRELQPKDHGKRLHSSTSPPIPRCSRHKASPPSSPSSTTHRPTWSLYLPSTPSSQRQQLPPPLPCNPHTPWLAPHSIQLGGAVHLCR